MIVREFTSLYVKILPAVKGTESIPNEPTNFSLPVSLGGLMTQKLPLRRGVCEDVIYSLYLSIGVE
jgi:hypothetical protein